MIRTAVRRPILTAVVFLVGIVFGLYAYSRLQVDMFPDVSLPSISVITMYPGASSYDVEENVTKPLEDQLSQVPNLKNIRSFSQENLSSIILEFQEGTDLDEAANDVRDMIDNAMFFLPEDVQRPQLVKFNLSQFPILIISIASKDTLVDIRHLVESRILDELEIVPGVGGVELFGGGRPRQIKVSVDKKALEKYGLTFSDVVRAIEASNMDIPSGNIEFGDIDYVIRIKGKLRNPEQVADIPIPTRRGVVLRLGDIADVRFGYEDRKNYGVVNGKEGVVIGVFKKSGSNIVSVADGVKKKLEELSKRYNIEVYYPIDFSRQVKLSINHLSRDLLLAIVIVVLATFLILRNLGASLIISLAIPISLIAAFIYLYVTGSTINLISLSALALAVGMVVDDAVVVIENIFYHREKGEKPDAAAIFGTQEVSQAIIASTLTRISVVLPLLLASGFIGLFFSQLVYSIAVTLLTSLLIAFTLTPMLAARFMSPLTPPKTVVGRAIERFLLSLEEGHRKLLRWSTKHRFLAITISVVIFILGMGLFRFVKVEFLLAPESRSVTMEMLMPPGTRLEVTRKVFDEALKIIESSPYVEYTSCRVGPSSKGFASTFGNVESSNFATCFIKIKEDIPLKDKEVAAILNEKLKDIPGPEKLEVTAGNSANRIIFGGGKDISIEIYGYDIPTTDSIARLIREKLEKIEGLTAISISRSTSRPELQIVFDREKLASYGLTPAVAGMLIRGAIFGQDAGNITVEGQDVPINVRLDDRYRKDINIIKTLMIPTPTGKMVYAGDVIKEIRFGYGPLSIERINKRRVVRVEADYYGRALGDVVKDIESALSEITLPQGVDIELAGSVKRQREAFGQLMIALIMGLVLLFLIMAGQLESFVYPAIIMLSVPFAFVGVALFLILWNEPLSSNAFVGMIMVMGIALSNAILMTDYMNILKGRGYDLIEAVVQGASRRLRPILITTITVILGLLPMALDRSIGAETYRGLAVAVIGGLTFSTIITLFFIPTVYSVYESWRAKRRKAA